MREVAIIGAGELGGSVAHALARRNAARAIRLIDERGGVADGKALDIAQAAPIESFSTRLAGSTDLGAVAGAAVVVVADPAGGGEWCGDDALRMLRRVGELARGAVIVCASGAHRDVVERGVAELRMPHHRLIGSAPEALCAAARAIVALEANVSPRDVSLVVLGIPPRQIVVPWEEATIGGFASTRVLGQAARRRVAARIPALWPPGPYTLAIAAGKTIDAIAGRSLALTCCFVARDGSGRSRTTALPVRLGASGVEQVIVPQLSPHDRVLLENAMAT